MLFDPFLGNFRKEGRDGKGIIFVFAAGNENRVGDDTNFQGFGANTRFTIPVASVGKNGTHAAYSTPGASVFIAAPGGDIRQSETTVVTALNNGGCGVDGGDGTSWAAPRTYHLSKLFNLIELFEPTH